MIPIWKMFGPSQGGRRVMVRPLWGCRRITAQYPCDFSGTAQAASGKIAIAVRGPSQERTISVRFGRRAGILQCHVRQVYGYGLMCRNSPVNKIVEATATLNPYENRTAAAAWKGGFGQLTGFVDSSQAKCG